ncbi:TPA: DUF1738 domain-containing protein [Aeromonas dhakensis]|nr:DUF1738 domain-containing protein [Aeromonas dhakensis]
MTDLYAVVTDTIIKQMEAGLEESGPLWVNQCSSMPTNFSTGVPYKGINVLLLWAAAYEHGYTSPYWLTFKQLVALGGNVKGQKSVTCIRYQIAERKNDQGEIEKYPMVKPFHVFNLDQIEGITAPAVANPGTTGMIEACERIFTLSGAVIHEEGDKACYMPHRDEIYLPTRQQFFELERFYSVGFHELTHWTAHKSRLDRDLSGRFGDEAYAFEELVAELGACFLSSDAGFFYRGVPHHASYIQSWLRVLKSDKKAIFSAASQAQKAYDYINGLVAVAAEQPEKVAA